MYFLDTPEECRRQIRKLTAKNKTLEAALKGKISEILENPYHYKPLGNVLAGKRRVHVLGCFVLIFSIDEAKHSVILKKFGHHDEAY